MKEISGSSEKARVFKESLFANASYKLVAFFITLILWLSILGRRDFVVTKDFEIDFVAAPGYSLAGQSTDKIRIKVSGPQPMLKKFKERNQILSFDLSDKTSGMFEVEMTPSKIEVPKGIKILGIRPNTVRVEIIEQTK